MNNETRIYRIKYAKKHRLRIFDTSNKNTISASKMEIDIIIFSLASAGR